MRELRPAPIDAIGVPLPIVPSERMPDRPASEIDRHHHFQPSDRPIFNTLGGMALRTGRIQHIDRKVHNGSRPNSFHKVYDETPISENVNDQFNLSILLMAGYIPKKGIDLWSNEPIERELSQREFEILRTLDNSSYDNSKYRYRYLTYGFFDVRKFYDQHIPLQAVELNDEALDFVKTSDKQKRIDLGHQLLEKTVEQAVKKIEPEYQKALEAGQLHPQASANAKTLVLSVLGSEFRRQEVMIPLLGRNLLQMVELSEAA